MKYTIKDFQKQFPNDDVCLEYIFSKKYDKDCKCGGKYYRITKRKAYACSACKKHIHPLSGTIFEKSSTDLAKWFHAIFLFSVSKNGVSGKEIERQLGVTYKTAWRIAKEIRSLMTQDGDPLSGTIEVDETYIGGRKEGKKIRGRGTTKTPVVGAVQRGGKAKVEVMDTVMRASLHNFILEKVRGSSHLMTDEFQAYDKIEKYGYKREAVKHGAKEYVRGKVHTNSVEGLWSQIKRSLDGTHHYVSAKHLQRYLDEFVFRYNLRGLSPAHVFSSLMERI